MDPAIAFFFIFYFFVASTVLMNVLIAVLLGNLCVMCGGVCVCVCVCVLCVCGCVGRRGTATCVKKIASGADLRP